MTGIARGGAVALACALCSAATAAAQDLPHPSSRRPDARRSSDRPRWAAGQPIEARRGSPVETLESLTGERSPESGRERDEIETDRDSFTPATSTAGWRRLIVESAYTFFDKSVTGNPVAWVSVLANWAHQKPASVACFGAG